MCFPVQALQAFQNAWYKAYNSHLKQKPRYKLPAGKIKMPKKTPNYEKNLFHVPFEAPPGIPADTSYFDVCGAKIGVQRIKSGLFYQL